MESALTSFLALERRISMAVLESQVLPDSGRLNDGEPTFRQTACAICFVHYAAPGKTASCKPAPSDSVP
jgi:hypothetical protein